MTIHKSESLDNRMKRQVANIVTVCRILCSIFMLFCPVFSTLFYTMYLSAGFTDMIDGTIARKTNTASEFGAKLDTAADVIFAAVSFLKILPGLHLQEWLWTWIVLIAAIKIGNMILGVIRRKTIISMHTIANKITGLLLFLLPLTLPVIDLRHSAPAVCTIATVSAIQESYYIGTGREIV